MVLSTSVFYLSLQVFSVPVEERRYKEMAEQQFGDRGREQAKTCADIMAKTGEFSDVTIIESRIDIAII